MTLEYLAGFIDGEGCINIQHNSARPEGSNSRVRLIVSQSKFQSKVLDEIKTFLEAKGYHCTITEGKNSVTSKNPDGVIRHLTMYRMDEIKHLLIELLPYLRVKRKNAKGAIEFITTYKKPYKKKEQTLGTH